MRTAFVAALDQTVRIQISALVVRVYFVHHFQQRERVRVKEREGEKETEATKDE